MNQRHIKRGMIASIMLYTSTSALVVVPALITVSPAHAQVVGIEGCVMPPRTDYSQSPPTVMNLGFCQREITNGGVNFVQSPRLAFYATAGEVNTALTQMEQRLSGASSSVNERLNGIDGKNSEQDSRLNGIDGKNAEQDGRLTVHDNRLDANDAKNTQQDGRLASIEDGAVFYNRDASGIKSGGVTFNDGTGIPVQLSNVKAGVASTDAVNHSQLNQAVQLFGAGAAINEDGSIKAPSYIVSGSQHNEVGSAVAALNRNTVQYVVDGDGNVTNEIRLSGTGSGSVVINNVAAGTSPNSAVNKQQLDTATEAAFAYTDHRFDNLSASTSTRFDRVEREVHHNRQEARGGIASAMGMAALRYDERPGKLSVAGGLGHFKSETAIVGGFGYTAEDSNFRANSALSYAPGSDDFGVNVGMSWTLN